LRAPKQHHGPSSTASSRNLEHNPLAHIHTLRLLLYTTRFRPRRILVCPTPLSAAPNSRSNCAPEHPRWASSSTLIAPPSPNNSPTAATTGCSSTPNTAPWATKNSPPCSAASPTAELSP